jgi:hypothetical protein
MSLFASFAVADSTEAANLVPITTPSAPSASAARTPLASEIPPAAKTGVSGTAETISGTREIILAAFIGP